MFQVLGSATSIAAVDPSPGPMSGRASDRGLGGVGETHAEVDAALKRASSSGVEWLPRHAPHRWI